MNHSQNSPILILASQSQYKQNQLKTLGLPFTTFNPDIDESPILNESAKQTAQRLAKEKAISWTHNHQVTSSHIILGSDQTAQCRQTLLGKPNSIDNAINQLMLCSAKTVVFYSAIAIYVAKTQTYMEHVTTTEVQFRDLSIEQITHYVHKDKPLDCAGSFKSEGLGIALFESITSTDPSALIGLPMIGLSSLLIDIAKQDSTFLTISPLAG